MFEENSLRSVIIGCGDIGRRIADYLISNCTAASAINAYVNSHESQTLAAQRGIESQVIDLDMPALDLVNCNQADVYYTVPPQKLGEQDLRSRAVIKALVDSNAKPRKVVLVSTTGVYGDCDGEWVTEQSPTQPQTERGLRRLDSEQQWLAWGRSHAVNVVVLRVPGIYANSRLPRERLQKRIPVVRANECGFSNRVHADDLARMCVAAMLRGGANEIYNATDGVPGKITEYLQAAAKALNYEPLPEISMAEAQSRLSAGMLSYLSESRKISNRKILEELELELLYPDYKIGLLT